nr:putative reverse transcriptase domain-containing protein [Tanacetum cinerariifolium]GFA34906.1 putative reverse transcriptase domain-containing protein [Tanacetum cinerariifolium]
HVENSNGIHVDLSKIEAVQSWKAPKTLTGIQSFLILTEDFVVYCDASNQGLGCVLMQRGKDRNYERKCRSPVLWAVVGENQLIGPEMVQETTNKVVLIKEWLKAARDRNLKWTKLFVLLKKHVEIMDREIKKLKHSRILIVKVRLNSKCGPEFTWEREEFMKVKYPNLFVDHVDETTS